MSEFDDPREKILETEFYQLKQKQSLCDGYEELLNARVRFLLTLLEKLSNVDERVQEINAEVQEMDTDSTQSALDASRPEEICDELSKSMETLNECEEAIQNVVSTTSDFLRDNFMICEEISDKLEQISNDIYSLRNGDENPNTPPESK